MNFDETERKMEFIVEQHAQFTADMQVLRETQAETERVVARLAYATLEGFKDVNAKIDALVDADIRLSDQQERLSERQEKARMEAEQRSKEWDERIDQRSKEWDERFNATVDLVFDSHQATDEALRKFIETVNRRLEDKSNGSGNG
jgi:hypothetical protein